MEGDLTVTQLIFAGVISNAEVEAAVTAYLSALDPGIVPLGRNLEVDVLSAIASHPFSAKLHKANKPGKAALRAAVRRAILLVRATRR